MSSQPSKTFRAPAARWPAVLCIALFSPGALGQVVFRQTTLDLAEMENISTQLVADDFQVLNAARPNQATVYLADDAINNNGVLDSFSGRLGWSVFGPGLIPGTPIASGSVTPTLTDTGLQDVSGSDVLAARFPISLPADLQPGEYWFAIHEGDWLSLPDGSPVWWVHAAPTPFIGEENLFAVADTTVLVPGPLWTAGTGHTAFLLENVIPEPIFATPLALATLCLMRRRR